MYRTPPLLFYGIGVMVGGSGGKNDPFATFHFFDLPGEIRNKIYDLVVPSCRVLITGNHPQKEFARYKKLPGHCRGLKPRYRLRPTVFSDCEQLDLTAALTLLKVCRSFNEEVISLLYSKTTFCFTTIKHINKFLNVIPDQGKKEVTSIEIAYSAYGEPQWTRDEFWKRKSDWNWAMACTRLEKELPALKNVKLDVRVADWPVQLRSTSDCFIPLEILGGSGLERVRLSISHYRFHQNRCDSVARALEDMMMTPEGRELRDIEEAIEAVRQMNEEEARMANHPLVRARKVLVIKNIPTAANSKPQIAAGQISRHTPNATKVVSRPVYRTKGLEGWARVSLDKVGVSWCGPPPFSVGITDLSRPA